MVEKSLRKKLMPPQKTSHLNWFNIFGLRQRTTGHRRLHNLHFMDSWDRMKRRSSWEKAAYPPWSPLETQLSSLAPQESVHVL